MREKLVFKPMAKNVSTHPSLQLFSASRTQRPRDRGRVPSQYGLGMGHTRKKPDKTSHQSRGSSQMSPDLTILFIFPLAISVFLSMSIFGVGVFDNWIFTREAVDTKSFPGDVEPAVLKASLGVLTKTDDVEGLVYTMHQVSRDETLSRIAFQYDLSPGTLISINKLTTPEDVTEGTTLIVPYRDGIRVFPRVGETASEIARRFNTSPDMVLRVPGTGDFFVSGSVDDEDTAAVSSKAVFLYPVSGKVIAAFGETMDTLTGISFQSDGIDLAAEIGTPVFVSRKGSVILTGNHSSYGLYVIVAHSGGWKSFYGNMSHIFVAPGDQLDSGANLGLVGDSGTARSPRLHFVLIQDGKTVDPLDYLF